MRGVLRRWAYGKSVRVAAATAILVGAVGSASAGDGFFSNFFGGDDNAAPVAPQYAPAVPDDGGTRYVRRIERHASRPLTVRLHRPKITHVAVAPTRPGTPGKITMYDDPTLRRGDAIMTVRGMRVFAGSRTWPYTDRDFVSVSDAGRMDKGLQKTLIAMDSLPRQ